MSTSEYLRRVFTKRALAVLLFQCFGALFAQVTVTTHHYDNRRTGWNPNETVLTPAHVSGGTFGVLETVTLDGQVDAQPLVVPNVAITAGSNQGLHTVVYVATEVNTVFAVDANSGIVLLSANFGNPVIRPVGCSNNSLAVGINSTPVIDPASNTLYVIVYTQRAGVPAYYLHALDLGSLTDKVMPRQITASHTLSDGSVYTFNPAVQRQRAALLLANGNVYAGFGSFCDLAANQSRGWLPGWQTDTLTPLPGNQILDTQSTSPNSFFLSSIWMSGSGLSADGAGNIVFLTGNSDPNTYDGITNIQESAVKVSPGLTAVLDSFTPDNQVGLDQNDNDFGAGGVMLLPPQPGAVANLAVAAGKDGNMFLMNENSLGGYSSSRNNVLGTYQIGGCWCAQSYFQDPADGMARVVSSGGNTVKVWKLATSPSPSLSLVTASGQIAGGQDPGFFTTVSSNGTSSPVIWALSKAASGVGSPIYLYAFDPESGGPNMTQLLKVTAGSWPFGSGNANLVPVVANGKVFVASYRQLKIFGLPQ